MHRSASSVIPTDAAIARARSRERVRQRRRRQAVEVGAGGLVAVRLPVPVAPEAQHPDVHLPAAPHHRHVGRHGAVHRARGTESDERLLRVQSQMPRQVKRARRDLHVRTLPWLADATGSSRRWSLLRLWRRSPHLPTPHPVPFSYLDVRVRAGRDRRHARRAHLRRRARSEHRRRPSGCSSPAVAAQRAAAHREAARPAPDDRRADGRALTPAVVRRRDRRRSAVAKRAAPALRAGRAPGIGRRSTR